MEKEKEYVLGLDVSTSTIGVALYENLGRNGKLTVLTHIAPKIKPKVDNKIKELFLKADIFRDEFLIKYKDFNITKIIIEEPLLGSNNVNTVATLLRFNGIISKACYDIFNVVPEFISSYDARKYAFPELMGKRTEDKKGNKFTTGAISKKEPVLFGAYPYDVDKKQVIWDKVCDLEPQVMWLYDKRGILVKENFDTSDAVCCIFGYMHKMGLWD
jgi:RNase H-fold protein (predicted Holliday junction resolvase)